MKKLKFILAVTFNILMFNELLAEEIRTTPGTPKIGDQYQNAINLDGKRRLILPEGTWEVNNAFEDKEGSWHATWKVITLTNRNPQSPFRMTIVRYFTNSTPRWATEDCEKKSNAYAFGHDTTGTKGSRTICSNFFYWSNPQELIRISLPRYYNFHWAKALSKLSDEFVQSLSKDQLMLEAVASQGGGLYVRQEILIDAGKINVDAEDFKLAYSSIKEGTNKKSILDWRINYVKAMSQGYLDLAEASPANYALNTINETSASAKKEVVDAPTKVNSKANDVSVSKQAEEELLAERNRIENEKRLLEEKKLLAEEKKRIELEKQKAEIEAIRQQKELLALQEERRQIEQKRLEKLQEDKIRQEKLAIAEAEAKAKQEADRVRKEQERLLAEETRKREDAERKELAEKRRATELAKAEEEKRKKEAEAAALAEKKKQQEEDRRVAAEAKRAEEEERKKLEAYKKSIPNIEVTHSEPDEFGVVVLDIKVTKPTKSLTINGESEGASKEGSYRVKRVLKKTGKTTFIFSAFDEFGNKGSYTLVAEHKSSGTPVAMDGMAAQNTARQERKAQIEKLEFDDCSPDFPYYLPHAASSLKKKNSKVSSKMSAILTAFAARDEGKSSQKIRDGYLCNQVSFAPNQEYPDGAYSILFREKASITNNNSPSPLANSFHFFAFGGIKGVQSYLERKTPICFEVVHYDERSKLFNSGFVVVELVNNVGFSKSVDSCNTLTEFAKPSKNLVEAIQRSISPVSAETGSATNSAVEKSDIKKLPAKASIKSCEQFLKVFSSRYKYAYDWPENSCEETSENDAAFVITGRNPTRQYPYNVSQYWYQPKTETVLYTRPNKTGETLRVSDFLDASKPPPGPNDTPDGVGKQAWRERCVRHAAAKDECAVAANVSQCMEIKLGNYLLGMGNMYCRGSQPDFRRMGID